MAHELSPRQAEIAKLVAKGLRNKEVGALLHISPKTVQVHLKAIFVRTGVTSRSGLMLWMIKTGRIDLSEVRL